MEFLTRPRRNPRRAYDAEGNEIRPMSLRDMGRAWRPVGAGDLPGDELRALGLDC